MTGQWLFRRVAALVAALVAVLLAVLVPVSGALADTSYVPISGAGSTWSSNAITQWAANVKQFGMTVNYAATGSSDGRTQFKNNTVDFGVSEIPYGLTDGGVFDPPPSRPYAYMPIVAGGTSFMYNLTIGGKRVTQLRLSGLNLTKIFTGVITSWADPAIKAENPGLTLPARRIVPVVRSDGSGTTAQFTLFMAKRYQSLWDAYCVKAGRTAPCGLTSQYPTVPGSGFVAQAGSTQVAGFTAQSTSEGAITYVEYSYALNAGFPVVKVLNQAGYYTTPKASNVAVGLLGATINTNAASKDYLTQNLDGVYANADKRAYPLSSYSYMIIPTAVTAGGSFSTAKGATLGAFAYYFLCEGQRSADVLGYSPLPINLVQAGLAQVRRIPGVAAKAIDIKTCNNPTFSKSGVNTLAANAPQPVACDRQGPTQCGTSAVGAGATGTGTRGGGTGAGGTGAGGTGAGGTGAGSGGTGAGGAGAGGTGGNGSGGTLPGGTTAGGTTAGGTAGAGTGALGTGGSALPVDPDTGQVVAGAELGGATNAAGQPVTLAASYTDSGVRSVLMVVSVLALLAAAVGPPLLARRTVTGRGAAGRGAAGRGEVGGR